jgi:hypothetical protein
MQALYSYHEIIANHSINVNCYVSMFHEPLFAVFWQRRWPWQARHDISSQCLTPRANKSLRGAYFRGTTSCSCKLIKVDTTHHRVLLLQPATRISSFIQVSRTRRVFRQQCNVAFEDGFGRAPCEHRGPYFRRMLQQCTTTSTMEIGKLLIHDRCSRWRVLSGMWRVHRCSIDRSARLTTPL